MRGFVPSFVRDWYKDWTSVNSESPHVPFSTPRPLHLPELPFRRMTKQLPDAFPSCFPYGGEFADPIPHLTLGVGAPLENLLNAEADVRDKLPIETQALEAWLMTGGIEPNSWSLRQRFPFAGHVLRST
jgi:hypothetical protein